MAVLAAGGAGCGTDGRDLAEPAPGATAPPLASDTTATVGEPDAVLGPDLGSVTPDSSTIELTSTAFAEGGVIADRFSCAGANVSPPLAWTGVPAGTAELVVVVDDPDANGFVHWAVAGIDPTVTGIGEGGVPEGAIEARNDSSEFGWFGPCPPPGDRHTYTFALYALAEPSGLGPGASGVEVIAAAAGSPAGFLTATYIEPLDREGP